MFRLYTSVRILLAAAAFTLVASAQTTTKFDMTLDGQANGFFGSGVVTINSNGTVILTSIGNGTYSSTASITNFNDIVATSPINLSITFTFNPGDTITLKGTIPAGFVLPALGQTGAVTGAFNITGGTGLYEGVAGSIPAVNGFGKTLTANSGTIHLTGPGTLLIPARVPKVAANGIISASAYGGFTDIAPGTWIEIYGSALATSSRSWNASDFSNNGQNAPTVLDKVQVLINNQPAYIAYISNGQINALVPSGIGTGTVQVIVNNGTFFTPAVTVNLSAIRPGLLAPASLASGGRQYVGALLPNTSQFRGTPSNPARPGDVLVIYGIGFGPVTPAVNAGVVASGLTSLTVKPQFLFDTTPADVSYYGLVPGLTGLYQFNVTVPAVPANSATPLTFNVGGTAGTQKLFIAVQP